MDSFVKVETLGQSSEGYSSLLSFQYASSIATPAARRWLLMTANSVLCILLAILPMILTTTTGSKGTSPPVPAAKCAPSPVLAPTASLVTGVAGVE